MKGFADEVLRSSRKRVFILPTHRPPKSKNGLRAESMKVLDYVVCDTKAEAVRMCTALRSRGKISKRMRIDDTWVRVAKEIPPNAIGWIVWRTE